MTKELVEEISELTCKNCGKTISKVWICKLEVPKVTRYVFFCTSCQRCLGVSNNKNPQSLVHPSNNLSSGTLQI
ncbi:MAG TPA: hypothetical protein VKD08_12180 [Ignavibacteriaceae bacterium]|nr:hypothetical protein [Ignavibacteriaceae bacterium]